MLIDDLKLIGSVDDLKLGHREFSVDGEGGRAVLELAIVRPLISDETVGQDCEAVVRSGDDGIFGGDWLALKVVVLHLSNEIVLGSGSYKQCTTSGQSEAHQTVKRPKDRGLHDAIV